MPEKDIVWVTKYRFKALQGEMRLRLRDIKPWLDLPRAANLDLSQGPDAMLRVGWVPYLLK
jgi:hypothetical protein